MERPPTTASVERDATTAAWQADDIRAVRYGGEADYAEALAALAGGSGLPLVAEDIDAERLRRRLLARSLRLTEGMAPAPYAAARRCAERFGIDAAIELYQASGAENAAIHRVASPVLLEVQGRLLALLDDDTLKAVMGHELGHYLCHGRDNPHAGASALAQRLLQQLDAPAQMLRAAARLSMAQELTADRYGLLACGGLEAALRLEMVMVTGLPAGSLTWDTQAYLAQSRELMESTLAEGDTAYGASHPEHSLRAYALWLFSESDLYQRLTGQGPGSRPIAEVDALLSRILGQEAVEVGTPMAFEEPPPELHACALAACVLVAAADGDLAEVEGEAIEKVFAGLLPDWRDYLDPELALARFQELAPLITAAGPRTQRALFALLVHVLGADGVAEADEIAVILGIGEALGCQRLFLSLLPAVLARFAVEIEFLREVEARAIPMPARRDEADAALAAFLAGVHRRGGGRYSLRRLLRLIGASQSDHGTLTRLRQAIAQADLRTRPELSEALDTAFDFEPLHPVEEPVAAAPTAPLSEARREVREALARLRDKLVSGDGRSPSIRLRRLRSGRGFDLHGLEAVSTGLGERSLTLLAAGQRARLLDAEEVGTHEAAGRAASALIALDREHRSRLEESGACDLYLGTPFVTGLAGGYLVRAPLVLHPVDIERRGRTRRSIALTPRRDETPIANQSLLRLLFHKKGLRYDDALVETFDALAAEGPTALLGELARLGLSTIPADAAGLLTPLRDRNEELDQWRDDRLEIEDCAVLGLFPQSSSDLLQDYDGLLSELERPARGLDQALAAAHALLPASWREDATAPAAGDAAIAPTPVLYSDPSQREVLVRARGTRLMVVDGPPGTGKSQVIVNLVADALARGERVAVVCEKRAALDVVTQRLDAIGLRDLLALVHDVQEDRRGLYDQIAARLEAGPEPAHDTDAEVRTASEAAAIDRELSGRAQLLARRADATGATPSLGQLHCLAAGIDRQALTDPAAIEPLAQLPAEALEAVIRGLRRLSPYADLWTRGSPWRGPNGEFRGDLGGLTADQCQTLEKKLEQALGRARDRAQRITDLGLDDGARLSAVRQAGVALNAVHATREARRSEAQQRAFMNLLARLVEDPDHAHRLSEAEGAWLQATPALAAQTRRVSLNLDPLQAAALDLVEQRAERLTRFLSPAWWKAKKTLAALLRSQAADLAGQPPSAELCRTLRARHAAAQAWGGLDRTGLALGLSDVPDGHAAATDWLRQARDLLNLAQPIAEAREVLRAADAWPQLLTAAACADWDQSVDQRRQLLALETILRHEVQGLRSWLPWLGEAPSPAELDTLLDAWRRDGQRLVEGDRLLREARAITPAAQAWLAALAGHPALPRQPEAWDEALRRSWAEAGIQWHTTTEPGVARLDGPTSLGEEAVAAERLGALGEQLGEFAVSRLRARQEQARLRQIPDAAHGARRSPEQKLKETLQKEVKKRRSLLPLRSLVRRYAGEGLLDLLPVWLLSPETMAVLFPRQPLFDRVIIDEASQCTVENGLPVLMRARQAVIAGDEQQMPPSSFFKRGSDDDDDTAHDESHPVELLDAESLLVLAAGRGERIGLNWHYRCQHEELIAFSNHAFYGGGLNTIPSVVSRQGAAALRWVEVEGADYSKGSNPIEARRVVELLHELLGREDQPSVGIVTFNLSQRRTILDEIDQRRAEDAAFAERLDTAMALERLDERPFVKNLEAVQGDERDVIVFSLGHAPVPRQRRDGQSDHYVPARFGPLGQKGGERRLNVAISRAKREIIIVASFDPGRLSVANSRHPGPKLFKAFLEFAHHLDQSRRAQAERLLTLVRSDTGDTRQRDSTRLPEGYIPLRAQLALALEQHGHRIELDVGTSGFRVDLAVVDPDDASRYRLGILCDEGQQAASPLASHIHIPRVLAGRGWQLLRLNAREWHRDRERVLRRIATALAA